MNTNFTPGPWHVKDNGLIYILPPDKSGNLVVAGCGQTYDVSDWEKERSLANASLIAAAPEMYDEIETTIELLQLVIDTYSLPEAVKKGLKERIETGKNTLKKARGEK